jgi:AraC-like DNA-binding protein
MSSSSYHAHPIERRSARRSAEAVVGVAVSVQGNPGGENDSGTAGADQDARDAPQAMLQSALEQLRLEGAIFFRSEWTDAFAFESVPNSVAGVLHPGAVRLIVFHIVAQGSCWVAGDDGERHWAGPGDVIVIPYGDRHDIGGETPADRVSVLDLVSTPPWSELPVIRHGGGGERTDIVCGYLHSTDPLFDPAMRVFPSAFVVRVPPGPSAGWIQASIAYALEGGPLTNASTSVITTRLPELVLIEVLGLHLATAPAADRGFLAALHDAVLAPALAQLHRGPERHWTVAELASAASVSRSLLDERFRQVLGRSPIKYLTEWRMHLAEELLTTTEAGIVAIAHRVGYDSEEAFSRAFKRAHGLSPSHWRAARATPPAPRAHHA